MWNKIKNAFSIIGAFLTVVILTCIAMLICREKRDTDTGRSTGTNETDRRIREGLAGCQERLQRAREGLDGSTERIAGCQERLQRAKEILRGAVERTEKEK